MWGQPPPAVRRAQLDPVTLSSRPQLRLPKEGEAQWRDLLFAWGCRDPLRQRLCVCSHPIISAPRFACSGGPRPSSVRIGPASCRVVPHFVTGLPRPSRCSTEMRSSGLTDRKSLRARNFGVTCLRLAVPRFGLCNKTAIHVLDPNVRGRMSLLRPAACVRFGLPQLSK